MNRYLEIASLFVRPGLTAFGGPAVLIGMMEDEFLDSVNVAAVALMV